MKTSSAKLTADLYTLEVRGSKRDFQELSYVIENYMENEYHTSGDNPAWDFMKEINEALSDF